MNSEKRYECIECGKKTRSFLDGCSRCNSNQYRNKSTEDVGESGAVDTAVSAYVKYASRLSMYSPA